MRGLINLNSTGRDRLFRRKRIRSAQNRFHSGNQDLWAERFGYIFIHSKLKSLKLIPFIPPRCQHDDRHLRFLANLPACLPSVHLRHHNIQNNKRNILVLIEPVHCFQTIACLDHLKSFPCRKSLTSFRILLSSSTTRIFNLSIKMLLSLWYLLYFPIVTRKCVAYVN